MSYDKNSFLQGIVIGRSMKGISVVSSGSSGETSTPKQVNFIDYDGTILYSYSAAEVQALQSLPNNPNHSGLTAQGWNWTLQQIKDQLTALPDGPVWIGQMYITQSGDTELDLHMLAGRLSPILTIAVNGTITVDWGDDTTADTVTGSSLSTRQAVPHTYAAPGAYTMKIHVVSGEFTFYGDGSYAILRKNRIENENRVYANCVKAVRLGSGITGIGQYAFQQCVSLASITIPSSVTDIWAVAFYGCRRLTSVTIPGSVTSIRGSVFQNCSALTGVAIPSSVTSIGNYAFDNCASLTSITIPSGITSIGGYAFSGCSTLTSIMISSSVTSIGNYAFDNCSGMAKYHIKPTTPPTLGTSVFYGIASDCVIYVPAASLNAYKTASNWSAYANYMQGE